MADEEKKEETPVEEPKEETPVEEPKTEEAPAEEEKEVEVPDKFKSLVESIETLSVLELSELVKVLEDKFGVSAAAPMAMAVAPAAGGGDAAGDTAKSSYTVELTAVGDQKIEVIKAVRDATGKGLKDAKDLVDAAASGAQVIKENTPSDEAQELKSKFEAAGASVELK